MIEDYSMVLYIIATCVVLFFVILWIDIKKTEANIDELQMEEDEDLLP